METTIIKTARQYIKTKQAVESASLALAELDEQLKELFAREGIESIEVDGKTVKIVHNHRRSFDIETLRNLVSAPLFRSITEPTVKTTLWDSAVNLGKIGDEVIDQVVTKTEYDQLKVK